MKKLRTIEVPPKSKNHSINNVGCLRYDDEKGSSCIKPGASGIYLEEKLHKIVGYIELYGNKFIVIENI